MFPLLHKAWHFFHRTVSDSEGDLNTDLGARSEPKTVLHNNWQPTSLPILKWIWNIKLKNMILMFRSWKSFPCVAYDSETLLMNYKYCRDGARNDENVPFIDGFFSFHREFHNESELHNMCMLILRAKKAPVTSTEPQRVYWT